ncbi:prepilin peptidase [Solimonas marina]|uniref:Prepilin type IV endopeptidase peptidase domain-containing protein n=1 Tax=Solimonas marina TaxID=2714601 RepID=A0A969W6Q3_9GAMM|nr:prepilin peptidase [Solimonas marina]NKF21417.1 hypothetical protein [Solimonas marina]
MAIAVTLLIWAAAVAWSDWSRRRVPNVALLLVLVPAVLALIVEGQGLLGQRWVSSLVGFGLVFALTLPGYVVSRLGAGDVKLAALMGLLLGGWAGLEMLLLAALLMGVAAVAMLMMKLPRQARFPAAPMFALAFVIEMFSGPWLFAAAH